MMELTLLGSLLAEALAHGVRHVDCWCWWWVGRFGWKVVVVELSVSGCVEGWSKVKDEALLYTFMIQPHLPQMTCLRQPYVMLSG